MISKEELKIEESKKLIESFFYDNEDDEDQDREIERIDKMTREEQLAELNKITAAMEILLKNPQEEIIRQQKLDDINKQMKEWQIENIPPAMSNSQNEFKEVDIDKLIEPLHVKKESSRFEKSDGPLPSCTATGQAYKFKKKLKEGEEHQAKHDKIWYGKSSSEGEVAKGIGMSYLVSGAAKYRFVKNGIVTGKDDVKNVFSQEIKGQSLSQYSINIDLGYKTLVLKKWLYSNEDMSEDNNYLDQFYHSEQMLPHCMLRLVGRLRGAGIISLDHCDDIIDICRKYLLLPSNIEAVFQNNEPDRAKKSSAGKQNEFFKRSPMQYYLTETQNKERLRASFYNYVTRNWDAHNGNLMLTEDGKHVIPFDFDVVHNGSSGITLSIIERSKEYLGPDKFKEYIQEFIGDLEHKKDKYHVLMAKLYEVLKIKEEPYDKTEIDSNLKTLKELAGIPLEQKVSVVNNSNVEEEKKGNWGDYNKQSSSRSHSKSISK